MSVFMKGEGLSAGAEGLFIPGTGGRLFSIYKARVSQQHLERGRMGHCWVAEEQQGC